MPFANAQWETSFQYRVPQARSVLDGIPVLLNSEMQSDVLTYQKTPRWRLNWLRSKHGLSLSMGSLNWFTLYSDTHLKFLHNLDSTLAFRAEYIDESDLESQFTTTVFEFEKRFGPLGIVLNGAPKTEKADADIGVALQYYGEDWSLRAFQNFFDAPRNKHNSEDDSFSKAYPYNFGVAISATDRLWHIGVRALPTLRWRFPQHKKNIEINEVLAQFESLIPAGNDLIHIQAQHDVLENRVTDLEPAVTTNVKRQRSLLRIRWQHALYKPTDSVLGGLELTSRKWNTANSLVLIPHGFWQVGFSENWQGRLGGDASFYRENRVLTIETRLNTALEFFWSEVSTIVFQATFDLDQEGTKRRFQGGNVQFSVML